MRTDVACDHCGLPVPAGLVEPGADTQFCCAGCRAVFAAIRGCGLDRYYEVRERIDAEPRPARVSDRGYEPLDDPAFHERFVDDRPDGLAATELQVEGVHCGACLWLIERLPQVVDGLIETRLDLPRRIVRVVWSPRQCRLSEIASALDRFGYPCHPRRGRGEHERRRAEDRRALVRIAVAGAIAGNVMVIAFALYGGAFHGMASEHYHLFRAASLALTAVAVLWPGRTFIRGAIAALRTRTGHMDLPIAIGLVAGLSWSAVNTVRGVGDVYFESLAMLIFLLLVGRWVQLRQQRASYDAVEQLFALTPSTARRVDARDATIREVPIEAIEADDLLEVRAGDSVPADGTVVEGASRLDLSLLTGESAPARVAAGDRVHAGTVNLSARLLVRTAATGQATRLGRLLQLVERSAAERAPVVRLADRVAGWFVVVVLGLALVTVAVWWPRDPSRALTHALALLVVTCPCALGLATPLAIMTAIGRAARRGILIKGADALEALARPGIVLFDKTGTLTRGTVALVRWHGPDEVRVLVAAAERHSAHPVARALADVPGFPEDLEAVVEETTGGGITATVAGHALLVGSPAFVRAAGLELTVPFAQLVDELSTEALTPVLVAVDGAIVAAAGLGDPIEADAAVSIDALCAAGWSVGLLSGDHPRVAQAVAARVGIDPDRCWGGATPEQKLEIVRERVNDGSPVVMVGDGVNDAAALAAATVGVSVRGGAEASLAAADVFLSEPGLEPLVALCRGARRTLGVIRRNLLASLGYNVVGATLAIAGVIDPLVAAILMPLSSLTVVTLSVRSRPFEASRTTDQVTKPRPARPAMPLARPSISS